MPSLGPAVYKMIVDTREFVEGVTLTRRELSLQKKILDETRTATENFSGGMKILEDQFRKGAIGPGAFVETARQLRAELPQNVAAQEAYNAALASGEAARRAAMTDEQQLAESQRKHQEALRGVVQLQNERVVSDAQAEEMLTRLREVAPEVLAAEQARSEAMRNGAAIRASLATEEQRLAEVRSQSLAAVAAGAITESEHEQHMERQRQLLPSVVQAERERARAESEVAAMVERNMTEQERYEAGIARLNALQGTAGMTAEVRRREEQRLAAQLPQNVEAERRRNAEIERGKQLTEQWMPVAQRRQRDIDEATRLFRAGHVEMSSYNNMMRQMHATQLAGVPIVGQYFSAFATGGAMGAGIAVVTTAINAAVGVARRLGQEIIRTFAEIDALAVKAQVIGTTVADLQTIRGAAKEVSNVDTASIDSALVSLNKNLAVATQGGSAMADAFRRLGLDPVALGAMNTADAFDQVAEAFRRNTDDASETLVAMKLFGRQGADLLPLLNDTTGALERQREHLRNVGMELRNVDAAAVDDMGDSVSRLSDTWQGLSTTVATSIAPHIRDISDTFYESAIASGEWKRQLDGVAVIIDLIGGNLSSQAKGLSMISLLVQGAGVPQALSFAGRFRDSTVDTEVAKQNALQRAIADTTAEFQSQMAAMETSSDESKIQTLIDKYGATAEQVAPLRALLAEKSSQAASKSADDFVKALERENKALQEVRDTTMSLAHQRAIAEMRAAGAAQSTVDEAQAAARLNHELEQRRRHEEVIAEFRSSLRREGETGEEAKRRQVGEKLTKAGIAPEERDQLMKEYDTSVGAEQAEKERDRLAQAEKRHADSVAETIDRINKKKASLEAYITTVGTAEEKTRAAAAAELDWDLAKDKASDVTRGAARKAQEDLADVEKKAKAAMSLTEQLEEAEKELQQSGMTATEKKLDDLRRMGADMNDPQVERLRLVSEELELREKIRDVQMPRTSIGGLQVGSREAAEAFLALSERSERVNEQSTRARDVEAARVRGVQGGFDDDRERARVLDKTAGPSVEDRVMTPPAPDAGHKELIRQEIGILQRIERKLEPIRINEETL
jgi:hypothetical protein